jgi:hypothetical protein
MPIINDNTLKIHTHNYLVVIYVVSNNFHFVSHLQMYFICI